MGKTKAFPTNVGRPNNSWYNELSHQNVQNIRRCSIKKSKHTFSPWFIERSSVHLTATLSNLIRFQ